MAQQVRTSPGWVAAPALVGLGVAAACILGYFELAEDLALSPTIAAFDEAVSAWIQASRGPALTIVMRAATWSADSLPVTAVVLVAVAIMLWRGHQIEALLTALVVALGTGLGAIAKRVAERPRPPVVNALIELPASYSFPSGHTLAALLLWTVIAFAVLRIARKEPTRWLAVVGGLVITVLVGTSRVYLGVHWPSDVFASWLLGVAWLALTLGGFLTWDRATGERV